MFNPVTVRRLSLVVAVMLAVAACGDDDAATTVATTVAATTVVTTVVTTVPATIAEATTTTTTTVPIITAVTTTTTTTPGPLVVEINAFGLNAGPYSLSITALPATLVATGVFDYPGPTYTVAADGFLCGTGTTTGVLAGAAVGVFKQLPGYPAGERLAKLVTIDPRVNSSLGPRVGWTEADLLATLGPADHEPSDPYLEVPEYRWYEYRDIGNSYHGLRFRVSVATGLVDQIEAGLFDVAGVLTCNA